MSTRPLSETSYAVLALVGMLEPATPYQLKQVAQVSLLHFWSIPHTQLYTECTRLTDLGLLDEQREQTGRRRRVYRVTESGRDALEQWREQPQTELQELRDAGLLKLFCGADPAPLAAEQLARHRERLSAYEGMADQDGMSQGLALALQAGIGHEREYVRFWSGVQSSTPYGAMPSTSIVTPE